jgi:hypothetical protein
LTLADLRDGSLTDISELASLKVITISVDSAMERLWNSGDLFLGLRSLLQSLPRQSLLEMVQIGPWAKLTLGMAVDISAFQLLDLDLADPQRFNHFKRLLLGFNSFKRPHLERSIYQRQPSAEDVRALGALLPRLRDANKFFVVNSDDAMILPSVADRLLDKY